MLANVWHGLWSAILCLLWSEECQPVSVFDLMYVCQYLPWFEECQSVSALAWRMPVYVCPGLKNASLCVCPDLKHVCRCLQWSEECRMPVSVCPGLRGPVCVCHGLKNASLCVCPDLRNACQCRLPFTHLIFVVCSEFCSQCRHTEKRGEGYWRGRGAGGEGVL